MRNNPLFERCLIALRQVHSFSRRALGEHISCAPAAKTLRKGRYSLLKTIKDARLPEENATIPFTFASASQPHQEHPERNEDFLLVDRQSELAVICDGVGSAVGADQAARLAARCVKTRWRHILNQSRISLPGESLDLDEVLRQLLEKANQKVRALKGRLKKNGKRVEEKGKEDAYASTTIALALLRPYNNGYMMAYAHAGDSRIYLLRQNEPLRSLTIDDGYFLLQQNKGELAEQEARRIEQASRADELTEEERAHFEKRNGITQPLGDEHLTLHLGRIELYPDDRILLCTDGIHDNLTDAEIEEVIGTEARTRVARTLLRRAAERSQQDAAVHIRAKKDDMSAIVITAISQQETLYHDKAEYSAGECSSRKCP